MSETPDPAIRTLPSGAIISGAALIAQIEIERAELPGVIEWERGSSELGGFWGAVVVIRQEDGREIPYALQILDHAPEWLLISGRGSELHYFHRSRAALGITESAVYDEAGSSMNATC